MKAVLIVFAVLASIVFVVVAIGYSLPVAHTARRSVALNAASGDVWAAITDVSAYPTWRSDVDSVEVLAPVNGQQAWREISGGDRISYAMTAVNPPSHLVSRITDRDLPFGGEWEYEVTQLGTGTRVTITERGEVYNPFFRFVSRFIIGHTVTLDGYLRALGRKFGEEVEPVDVASGVVAPRGSLASIGPTASATMTVP